MTKTIQWTGDLTRIANNEDDLFEGDLRHYLKEMFNAPNVRNRYHGFRHMGHVTYEIYQACLYYKDRLSKRQIRNVLIAGMFHDYDHTGKKGPDRINIDRAIAGLRKHILPEDLPYIDEIIAIMEVTEYPHKDDVDTLTLEQRIMRDADMAQAFDTAWIESIIFGLGSEGGVDPVKMFEDQQIFLSGLHFLTAFGEERYGQAAIDAKRAETLAWLDIVQ